METTSHHYEIANKNQQNQSIQFTSKSDRLNDLSATLLLTTVFFFDQQFETGIKRKKKR